MKASIAYTNTVTDVSMNFFCSILAINYSHSALQYNNNNNSLHLYSAFLSTQSTSHTVEGGPPPTLVVFSV